jgi:hypothetical protein
MREPHIILVMENESYFKDKSIESVEDIAHCHKDGSLMIFDSFDDAKDYQEEHTISGRVAELPTF